MLFNYHITDLAENTTRVVNVISKLDLTELANRKDYFIKNYCGVTLNDFEVITNIVKVTDLHIGADTMEDYDILLDLKIEIDK